MQKLNEHEAWRWILDQVDAFEEKLPPCWCGDPNCDGGAEDVIYPGICSVILDMRYYGILSHSIGEIMHDKARAEVLRVSGARDMLSGSIFMDREGRWKTGRRPKFLKRMVEETSGK